jgi:thiosulfate/3-mercaptopyruvate sulfurtransferase
MRPRIPYRRIDVAAAADLVRRDDVLTFDVRDAASFARAHIAGARHLSEANLPVFITAAAKARPILIYCYRGHASQEYAQTFSDFGFAEVYSLDGGYEDWGRMQQQVAAPPAEDGGLRQWLTAQGFPPGQVNATIVNATTPLMKAAHLGNASVLRALLAAGARVDAINADGNNALWLACVGNHPDLIDLLVSAGIDIDNRNESGATALMYAASSGRDAVVAHLLAKGADTAAETPDGFTALDLAATLECLALLRHAGRGPRAAETDHEHHRA